MSLKVLALINRLGETSKLDIDPDMDSHAVMKLSLQFLTENQMKLNMLMNQGVEMLSREYTEEEMSQYIKSVDDFGTLSLERITDKCNLALSEDKSNYGQSASLHVNIPRVLADYETAIHSFMATVHRLGDTDKTPISFNDFVNSAERAVEANHAFSAYIDK